MDLDFSIIDNTTTTLSILACLVTFIFLISWSKKKRSVGPSPPEPGGSWPIIGHLLLMGGKEAPHKALARLADQCGPIFKLRLGKRPVVVVSNSEMAKECLLTNDKEFAGRPNIIAFELLIYNHAIITFAHYGPYWRETRKLSTQELLSSQRLASMMHSQVSEVRLAVKGVYDKWALVTKNQGMRSNISSSAATASVTEMKDWFRNVFLNMIMQEVVGMTYSKEEAIRCIETMTDFFHLAGAFTMADALPYLRCFDIGGYENQMRKTAKELDYLSQSWLESHRKNREVHPADHKKDLMDILIDIFDKGDAKKLGYDADTTVKATCLFSSVTVTWALCLLLNNPRVMRKVQEELDTHVGKERMINIEPDLSKLVYLHAVIKETLRLYPPAPLLIPHEALNDVVVGGYHIPAGTMLFVNIHKIQVDPLIYDDPLVFRPERFLTANKHIDVKGHNFELLPFSSGRRICPGISYALQTMHLSLASLLHCFEITTLSSEPIDMTESKGIATLKATPLEVILTPRLPHHLYDTIDD